jgi:hypothetical protein
MDKHTFVMPDLYYGSVSSEHLGFILNTHFHYGLCDPKSTVHCRVQRSDSLHPSSPSFPSSFRHRFHNGFPRNVRLCPAKRSHKVSSPCRSLFCLVSNPSHHYQHGAPDLQVRPSLRRTWHLLRIRTARAPMSLWYSQSWSSDVER